MPSDCRANTHFTTVVIGEAIARMMLRKTGVSNNAAAMALWETMGCSLELQRSGGILIQGAGRLPDFVQERLGQAR